MGNRFSVLKVWVSKNLDLLGRFSFELDFWYGKCQNFVIGKMVDVVQYSIVVTVV